MLYIDLQRELTDIWAQLGIIFWWDWFICAKSFVYSAQTVVFVFAYLTKCSVGPSWSDGGRGVCLHVEAVEDDGGEEWLATGDVRGPTITSISWLYWRQNSTSVSTWQDNAGQVWQRAFRCPSHRSRCGFRIVELRWRRNGAVTAALLSARAADYVIPVSDVTVTSVSWVERSISCRQWQYKNVHWVTLDCYSSEVRH